MTPTVRADGIRAELLDGWRLFRDGDYAGAAAYFADVRTRYPESNDAALGLAWSYLLQDARETRVEEGRQLLISLLNEELPIHVQMLAVLAEEGNAAAPRTAGEALLLANDALYRRENEEAVRLARRAQQFAPHNTFVLTNVGTALAFAGKDDEALPLLRQAAQTAPTPAIWHNIGMIEAKKKNLKAAEEAWRQALALVPDYQLSHEALAWHKLRAGHIVPAWKHWQTAAASRKRNRRNPQEVVPA